MQVYDAIARKPATAPQRTGGGTGPRGGSLAGRWGYAAVPCSERDPEVAWLLDTVDPLLNALRRSMTLADVLLVRAKHERPLTPGEEREARHEIATTREAIEHMEAMLMLRRQGLRPM
jgi:hypothetical protein